MRESLTLTIQPNGDLLLAASNDCRAWIKEKREQLDDVSMLRELTEPYWTNGSFEPFAAGAANPFVGLTDAPCIAEALDYPDSGQREIDGRLWWYPDYMLRSPADELMRRGRTVFQLAKGAVMTYKPEHLRSYARPNHYAGPDYFGYYPFLGQSRDSSALERSNFQCGLERIGGESETVLVIRDFHWAVGWVETIYVHESDEPALRKADEIKAALAGYPVVDESRWSNLEWGEVTEYWAGMRPAGRLDAIKRSRSHVSIFAARHADFPQDDNGALFDYLNAP